MVAEFGNLRISFAWYDIWVGYFYDSKKKTHYFVPLAGVLFRWSKNTVYQKLVEGLSKTRAGQIVFKEAGFDEEKFKKDWDKSMLGGLPVAANKENSHLFNIPPKQKMDRVALTLFESDLIETDAKAFKERQEAVNRPLENSLFFKTLSGMDMARCYVWRDNKFVCLGFHNMYIINMMTVAELYDAEMSADKWNWIWENWARTPSGVKSY